MTDEGDGSAGDGARDRPADEEASAEPATDDGGAPAANEDAAEPDADGESADLQAAGADVADAGDEGEPEVATPTASDVDDPDPSGDVVATDDAPGSADRERSAGAEVAAGTEQSAADAETGEGPAESVDAAGSADGSRPADDDSTADATAGDAAAVEQAPDHGPGVPEDVRTYDRFTKIDGGTYERANEFLRERTYVTAREWAIARLCADFRTETGVEMTKIGEHLPELVPFMTDTYSPQAVNQARASFEEKVRKSGATFLYGAMSDFFAAEELDDVMYEATEVAKFLLEVEGVDLDVEAELEAEEAISEVMREVREHSAALRHDEVVCPECGHHVRPGED